MLAEKEFIIPNDTCGEYFVPANQKTALVYDQELVKNFITGVEEWKYTDKLKLPVYCVRCSAEIKLAKDKLEAG